MVLTRLAGQVSRIRGGAFGSIKFGQTSNEVAEHARQQSTQGVIGAGSCRLRHRRRGIFRFGIGQCVDGIDNLLDSGSQRAGVRDAFRLDPLLGKGAKDLFRVPNEQRHLPRVIGQAVIRRSGQQHLAKRYIPRDTGLRGEYLLLACSWTMA